MTELVPAVHRVDLSEEICYESSLSRIQVSGSDDGVEASGVWGAVPINVQSPELRISNGSVCELVLSRKFVDPCVDSNAMLGGNDCGISVIVGEGEISRC
jgi:hypothetical protein